MAAPRAAGTTRSRCSDCGGGGDPDYEDRLKREIAHFAGQLDVHALPDIFHYWSNTYLLPILKSFGFDSPDDFFLQELKRIVAERPGARIVSLGAGNGDLEVRLARALVDAGQGSFRMVVTDINETMLARGRANAIDRGVADRVDFEIVDFNDWQPDAPIDVVIANQSLHHVQNLEHLLSATRTAIGQTDGWLLTSDMIGRNGHMRWPEALEVVQRFWQEMPERCRYNHQLDRHEPEYVNHDCSDESFEGIRAQDILPLLLQYLHFETFVAFGNVIDVFVDRAFGHNFDAADPDDRAFIDRVHQADDELLRSGRIKPTHMIASLRTRPVSGTRYRENLSPEFCVRRPG